MILQKQETLLTPDDLAEFTSLSKTHLARLRSEGGGPPFVKLGDGRQSSIRYRREAVLAWLEKRERTSTSDTGRAA